MEAKEWDINDASRTFPLTRRRLVDGKWKRKQVNVHFCNVLGGEDYLVAEKGFESRRAFDAIPGMSKTAESGLSPAGEACEWLRGWRRRRFPAFTAAIEARLRKKTSHTNCAAKVWEAYRPPVGEVAAWMSASEPVPFPFPAPATLAAKGTPNNGTGGTVDAASGGESLVGPDALPFLDILLEGDMGDTDKEIGTCFFTAAVGRSVPGPGLARGSSSPKIMQPNEPIRMLFTSLLRFRHLENGATENMTVDGFLFVY